MRTAVRRSTETLFHRLAMLVPLMALAILAKRASGLIALLSLAA